MSYTDHDHRGEYASDNHDHYDYAERHHRHYDDDERTAGQLRDELRSYIDGLTAGGAWGDDGQVAQLITCKQYAGNGAVPGCTIVISTMNGEA